AQRRAGTNGWLGREEIRRALEVGSQAPVKHERLAVSPDHDVRRLDVAMNDSHVMRIGDRVTGAHQMLEQCEKLLTAARRTGGRRRAGMKILDGQRQLATSNEAHDIER